jgi:hypothetical protein
MFSTATEAEADERRLLKDWWQKNVFKKF